MLNSQAPKSAFSEMPEIAWDGNEFLVVWNDGRVEGGPRQVAMRKFDGTGKPIGDKEQILSTDLDPKLHTTIPGWSGKSVIGHDGLHVIVGQQRADVASPSSVWMCIEPPYSN
ncbi:MAG TPA: hypothetical protein PK156_24225 [Polyangium sp.]|nr:hypothetical protein [Polyangium sp.]